MVQEITNFTENEPIASLIKPLEAEDTDTTDKTLGSVLSKVTSSHEAVFIFDDKDKFIGMASPYKTLYASHFPYDTKVETVLMMPPALTKETPLYDTVTHMLATKIYTLPVFDSKEKIIGVISGHDILKHITANQERLSAISAAVTVQKPVTAPDSSSVGDIHNQLKESGVTRIILTSNTGAMTGMVTRNDLARAFIKPSVRRRYPSEGSLGGFYSRGGEKKFRSDYPARRYASTGVDTLPSNTKKVDLVNHLGHSQYNNVVLIDSKFRPTGLLSTRNLLQAAAPVKTSIDAPLIIHAPTADLPEDQVTVGERHLSLFWDKLRKRMDIEKIQVTTKVRNNAAQQPRILYTTIKVTPIKGEPLIANAEARNYLDSLQTTTSLIEKQRRRSGLRARKTRQKTRPSRV